MFAVLETAHISFSPKAPETDFLKSCDIFLVCFVLFFLMLLLSFTQSIIHIRLALEHTCFVHYIYLMDVRPL